MFNPGQKLVIEPMRSFTKTQCIYLEDMMDQNSWMISFNTILRLSFGQKSSTPHKLLLHETHIFWLLMETLFFFLGVQLEIQDQTSTNTKFWKKNGVKLFIKKESSQLNDFVMLESFVKTDFIFLEVTTVSLD